MILWAKEKGLILSRSYTILRSIRQILPSQGTIKTCSISFINLAKKINKCILKHLKAPGKNSSTLCENIANTYKFIYLQVLFDLAEDQMFQRKNNIAVIIIGALL